MNGFSSDQVWGTRFLIAIPLLVRDGQMLALVEGWETKTSSVFGGFGASGVHGVKWCFFFFFVFVFLCYFVVLGDFCVNVVFGVARIFVAVWRCGRCPALLSLAPICCVCVFCLCVG